MSTPPVTDSTLNAGEAGKGGMTVRHCLLDYTSTKFHLQASPGQHFTLSPVVLALGFAYRMCTTTAA